MAILWQLLDTYHVLPINDLREHSESADCWCEPRVEDKGTSVIVIHHALDGREAYEEGRPLS